jgi:carbon-monoxide dehydrogenase medium subunit
MVHYKHSHRPYMKPASFDYVAATSVEQAVALHASAADAGRYLAGGQSLLAALSFRLDAPTLLIDIGRIAELKGVRRDGDCIVIGTTTCHAEIARDPLIARHLPLIAEAVAEVAHPAIRNRGTFGGSIALADPAAEMPACALALSAIMVVQGPEGERKIAADAFFRGSYETALQPGDLLTRVEIPIPPVGARHGFAEIARRRGDYAMAGLAMMHGPEPRIVWFALSDRPVRARRAEAALQAGQDADAVATLATEGVSVFGDANASEPMKRHLARQLLARTLRGTARP